MLVQRCACMTWVLSLSPCALSLTHGHEDTLLCTSAFSQWPQWHLALYRWMVPMATVTHCFVQVNGTTGHSDTLLCTSERCQWPQWHLALYKWMVPMATVTLCFAQVQWKKHWPQWHLSLYKCTEPMATATSCFLQVHWAQLHVSGDREKLQIVCTTSSAHDQLLAPRSMAKEQRREGTANQCTKKAPFTTTSKPVYKESTLHNHQQTSVQRKHPSQPPANQCTKKAPFTTTSKPVYKESTLHNPCAKWPLLCTTFFFCSCTPNMKGKVSEKIVWKEM